ncbi:hypothetical protein ES677_14475 [Bizionia gelidisalsuginis]|uniref:Gliding motility-associated protein GldM N-terminal domain-containing protein n=1 Tax=Bizionia gelidisalsuginis TaxID=291188 RepID=A0ABY3M731_9FLAO|nr:hypothetical protein [Bizionia gelidisalsuginis]TYC08433.1 hypothetical protein ES677_14475 [Bizionia gelidisalsuginis]
MRKITFLVLLVIASSCKQENEPYSMYGLLNEEFVYSSEMLKVQIAESLSNDKLINNESAKVYDNLTSEYLAYLDRTYSELINHPKIEKDRSYDGEFSKKEYINDLFFIGDEYNEKGTEFISKLEKYRTEILKLIKDRNLTKRVNATLNTMYIQNREGKKIKYLNYLYQDMPLISVLTHMKNKEKSILEFENDFLKNIQLNE